MRIKLPKLSPREWLNMKLTLKVPKRKPKAQLPDLTPEEAIALTKPVASFLMNPKASKPKGKR